MTMILGHGSTLVPSDSAWQPSGKFRLTEREPYAAAARLRERATVVTVTITGAQGSGKTRIAHAIAEAISEIGFDYDLKQEGAFTGGSVNDRPRVLIEEING